MPRWEIRLIVEIKPLLYENLTNLLLKTVITIVNILILEMFSP